MNKVLISFFVWIALSVLFQSALPIIIFFFLIPTLFSKNINQNSIDDFLNKFNQNRWKKWKKFVKNNFDFTNNLQFNFNNMIHLWFKKIAWIIAIIAFILIILDWIVNVPAGHVSVLFDRWRWVLETPLWEWIHLKIPFWQKSTIMSTRIEAYTMSIATSEWNIYWDDAVEALTKDGQKVQLDMTVQYHLEKTNAPSLYQTIWLDYVEKVIRPWARSISREVITWYTSKELFQNETRQKAQSEINEKMKTYLNLKNVALDWVLVRNIKFSNIYLNAIEEKQIAEQKIQKAEFEKEEALIRKEKKIIEAEAEAESIILKWQALKANKEMIQLEMINKLSPNIKWWVLPDSVMPLLDMKNLSQ